MRRVAGVFVALLLAPPGVSGQGMPVGPEFQVNTYATNTQEFPSVAADGSGNFVVVWHSYTEDGSHFGIFGQRYSSSGAPLGTQFRVNTYTTNAQRFARAAADAAGNFVVVWESHPQYLSAEGVGVGYGVFAQRYASTGVPLGGEFRVNTYSTSLQYHPSVAARASGEFVVVWTSLGQDGFQSGIFGQRYAASGAPVGPEFRVNTYTTLYQELPSVAVEPNGNFVVVWRSNHGEAYGDVFGQRYATSGAPVGPEFRVNTYSTNAQTSPVVASDPAGNFVVAWQSTGQDGFASGLFGQRYASGGAPLGPEFRVNTTTFGASYNARIATDASGNFVVAWYGGPYGVSLDIFGQRYSSSGAPVGPEFRVNTYTTQNQLLSDVACDSAGDFVVVWQSAGQDGAQGGVFGQRFSPIVPVELIHYAVE